MRRLVLFACVASIPAAPAVAGPRVIVLIGGDAPHNPNVHDANAVVTRLGAALSGSSDLRKRGVVVRAYPEGWPADPAAFDGAATVVCYFDGLERHPLLDAGHRATLARLMARGVGLAMFHQASTLPPEDRGVPLVAWLGAARYGMVDRTVEPVTATPLRHPIGNGVGRIAWRDEFYPSLRFAPHGVTPILRAKLHLETAPKAAPTWRTLAWAFARPGGGRSFGFTGLHYLDTLDQPQLRTLLLNAIVWTARLPVPRAGIRSPAETSKKGKP